jgi:oligoribonuclease NrnB/cAMP/cGMP phosphodiesterase (DHH superfamily)
MPRPLCIFHKNCLDGYGAAAVVRRKEPDCEFLAMQYGQPPPPRVDGRRVYIVDFGLPAAEMRALRAQAAEVIWLDHHATQVPVRAQLGWGVVDTSECGTSLTWKHLFPDQPPPPVVAYIKDKDLWRWELPDSRAVAEGLLATYKGERFADILDADLAEMARIGRPALEALAARVAEAVRAGIVVERPYGLTGVRALALKWNQDQNAIGEQVCLPTSAGGLGYDLAILFYKKSGGPWVHSLRSARVDCAAIAAARGGGGHPTSACYLDQIPFTESTDSGAKPAAKS